MNTEKRMIHSYEVVSSLKIGEKEVVLAMDEKNTDGEKYMTCFVERNELFELYHESMLSDDYAVRLRLQYERRKSWQSLHSHRKAYFRGITQRVRYTPQSRSYTFRRLCFSRP